MQEYLALLQHVLDHGADRNDRTGVGTRAVFGRQLRFDLSEGFPLVTTKKIHLRRVLGRLTYSLAPNSQRSWIPLQENCMLIDHSSEKLVNAIIYFVQNTKYCGKTKLFKLLYFLDFEHFSVTGRSVTGLEYFAWPKGPVPVEIFEEVESPEKAIKDSIQVTKRKTFNGKVINDIAPLKGFSPEYFSKRELKILDTLSKEYRDSYADNMVEATHLENLPWHQIYEVQGLKQQVIPYELALKKSEYEQVIKNVRENAEFEDNYK